MCDSTNNNPFDLVLTSVTEVHKLIIYILNNILFCRRLYDKFCLMLGFFPARFLMKGFNCDFSLYIPCGG